MILLSPPLFRRPPVGLNPQTKLNPEQLLAYLSATGSVLLSFYCGRATGKPCRLSYTWYLVVFAVSAFGESSFTFV